MNALSSLGFHYAGGVCRACERARINGFALDRWPPRALDLASFGSYAIAWAVTVISRHSSNTGVYHVLFAHQRSGAHADYVFIWLQLGIWARSAHIVMAAAGLLIATSE